MGVTETLGLFAYFLITAGIAVAMGVRHKPHRVARDAFWEDEDPAVFREIYRPLALGSAAAAVPAPVFDPEALDQSFASHAGILPVYVTRTVAGRRKRGRAPRLESGSRRRLSLLEAMAECATSADGGSTTMQSRANASNVPAALGPRAFSSSRR